MDKVVLIAGPTASGKSSLALKLALENKGVILNGDSLQVYRGLEILTAQPSSEDREKCSHGLYGVLDPSESCSVGKWLDLVHGEIETAFFQGKTPYIVGGTGLYFKALQEGISQIPPVDPEVRRQLSESNLTQEELFDTLMTVDPAWAKRIEPQDQQRTHRGLEVYYGTGKPLSYWQNQEKTQCPYSFETHLLMPTKEELDKTISERLDAMLAQGLIEEVDRLGKQSPSPQAQKAIGFQEFQAYLQGRLSLEEAKELTGLRTRQFAKRQRTWFRNQFTS